MQNLKNRLSSVIHRGGQTRVFSLIALVAIVLGLPITIFIVGQRTLTQQNASGSCETVTNQYCSGDPCNDNGDLNGSGSCATAPGRPFCCLSTNNPTPIVASGTPTPANIPCPANYGCYIGSTSCQQGRSQAGGCISNNFSGICCSNQVVLTSTPTLTPPAATNTVTPNPGGCWKPECFSSNGGPSICTMVQDCYGPSTCSIVGASCVNGTPKYVYKCANNACTKKYDSVGNQQSDPGCSSSNVGSYCSNNTVGTCLATSQYPTCIRNINLPNPSVYTCDTTSSCTAIGELGQCCRRTTAATATPTPTQTPTPQPQYCFVNNFPGGTWNTCTATQHDCRAVASNQGTNCSTIPLMPAGYSYYGCTNAPGGYCCSNTVVNPNPSVCTGNPTPTTTPAPVCNGTCLSGGQNYNTSNPSCPPGFSCDQWPGGTGWSNCNTTNGPAFPVCAHLLTPTPTQGGGGGGFTCGTVGGNDFCSFGFSCPSGHSTSSRTCSAGQVCCSNNVLPTNTPFPTATPRPTQIATNTPGGRGGATNTPTPGGGGGSIKLVFSLLLQGIRMDSTTNTDEWHGRADAGAVKFNFNSTPKHTTRNVKLFFYKENNIAQNDPTLQNADFTQTVTNGLTYDAQTGTFKANVTLQNIPAGSYTVVVKPDNYLAYSLDAHQFTAGSTVTIPGDQEIYGGDVNNDNVLDVKDYNEFLTCYSNPSTNCDAEDINDNTNTTPDMLQIDLSLFLYAIAYHKGI